MCLSTGFVVWGGLYPAKGEVNPGLAIVFVEFPSQTPTRYVKGLNSVTINTSLSSSRLVWKYVLRTGLVLELNQSSHNPVPRGVLASLIL